MHRSPTLFLNRSVNRDAMQVHSRLQSFLLLSSTRSPFWKCTLHCIEMAYTIIFILCLNCGERPQSDISAGVCEERLHTSTTDTFLALAAWFSHMNANDPLFGLCGRCLFWRRLISAIALLFGSWFHDYVAYCYYPMWKLAADIFTCTSLYIQSPFILSRLQTIPFSRERCSLKCCR